MSHPKTEPSEWTVGERRVFLFDKGIESRRITGITPFMINPEENAFDAQLLRRKLDELGYSWALYNEKGNSVFCIHPKINRTNQGHIEITDKSENKALVIGACRALLEKEKND